MFNPQIILLVLVGLLGSMSFGFYSGQDWANTKHEAAKAEMMALHQERVEREQARANELSDKLAKAEGRITTKTIEVIKYVDRYTTGTTLCLGPAAIGVLQPGSDQGIRPPTGQPVAEDAGTFAASDRDVAYFIASANQHYETCSARLTALVDFELTTNPEPK